MTAPISLTAAACAFVLGVSTLLIFPVLPSSTFILLLCGLLVVFLRAQRRLMIWLWFLSAGLLWATYWAHDYISTIERYAQTESTVRGKIKSANIHADTLSRTRMTVTHINGQPLLFWRQITLMLNFADPNIHATLQAGQTWQFRVAIRAAHSVLNEGGFDKQRWAIATRQALEGRVNQATLVDNTISWRQRVINYALPSLEEQQYGGILLGLTFGERGRMSAENRTQLINTGTAHLMAISGLHIGLMSMIGVFFARIVQLFLPLRFIGVIFPLVMGVITGSVYVWLSGANIPALRTMFSIMVVGFLCWRKIKWGRWQVWSLIVALLLIIDPLTILSDSFLLSCCAVAALIFIFQWGPILSFTQYKKVGFIVKLVYLQVGMLLLLAPLQILIFKGISGYGIVANIMVIPIVTFITLPCLIGALILGLFSSTPLWGVANCSIEAVFRLIALLDSGWISVSHHMLLLSVVGWLGIIFWRCRLGIQWLPFYVVVFSVLLLPDWFKQKYRWRIDILDVAHGLAVVIEANQRAVIYDTGNRWKSGSMATSVILPLLRWQNWTLEGVMLSHQDRDHDGGAPDLLQAYPESWQRSPSMQVAGLDCHRGEQWVWQMLTFTVLWPPAPVNVAKNQHSCVIRVSDGQFSLLLTGDIERKQEAALVEHYKTQLQSTLLQVPHHGSRSSSSDLFLRSVKPDISLSSNGRYTPWALPAVDVRQRYQSHESQWYSTAYTGQITLFVFDDRIEHRTYRVHYKRWYHNWFGQLRQSVIPIEPLPPINHVYLKGVPSSSVLSQDSVHFEER